mgnify:CR=1 FL=1
MPNWLKPEDESKWQQAKDIAKDQNKENDYGFIVSVFKKIKKSYSNSELLDSQIKAIHSEITTAINEYTSFKELKDKKNSVNKLAKLLKELSKVGELDFNIFMNPLNSEALSLARQQIYENNSKLNLPEKIVINENVIKVMSSKKNTIKLVNLLGKSIQELNDIPEIEFIDSSKEENISLAKPIYDLCLVLKPEAKANNQLMFQEIIPQFPKEIIFNEKELSEQIKNMSEVVVDKLFNTPKVFLHKLNNEIKIISEYGVDLTRHFDSEIFSDLQKEQRDYILECNVTYMLGKKPSKSEEILSDILCSDFIDSRKETQIVFNVTDVLYLDKDVTNLKAIDRKKLIKTISYSHHLKQSPFVITENMNQVVNGAKLMSKLMWSNGAILKNPESKYIQGISDSLIGVI